MVVKNRLYTASVVASDQKSDFFSNKNCSHRRLTNFASNKNISSKLDNSAPMNASNFEEKRPKENLRNFPLGDNIPNSLLSGVSGSQNVDKNIV